MDDEPVPIFDEVDPEPGWSLPDEFRGISED